jgi:hypothetical protein
VEVDPAGNPKEFWKGLRWEPDETNRNRNEDLERYERNPKK